MVCYCNPFPHPRVTLEVAIRENPELVDEIREMIGEVYQQ